MIKRYDKPCSMKRSEIFQLYIKKTSPTHRQPKSDGISRDDTGCEIRLAAMQIRQTKLTNQLSQITLTGFLAASWSWKRAVS